MKRILIAAAFSIVASAAHAADAKPVIYTVNYPLQYFAERIAGDHAEIVFPEIEGDPAYWVPEDSDVQALQQADLILLNGAGYAKWVKMVSLPKSKLVNTSIGFKDQYHLLAHELTHQHGPQGKHEHGDTAFTTWLDLQLAVKQAEVVKDALVRLLPGKQKSLEASWEVLRTDLIGLDADIQKAAEALKNKPLVVSHPVYQYFTRRYGLNIKSVHWEPDEFPSQKQWMEFEHLLLEHPAKTMIWEGQPMAETVKKLKELGIQSVVFDPCGNQPEDGDFLHVFRRQVTALSQ